MRPADQTRAAALDKLYATLPAINCQGLCWDSCGRLPLLKVEQTRIAETTGITIPVATSGRAPMVCPALTMFRQCAAYTIRPLICRLWGLVDNMPCTYGCAPDGGRLSVAEGYELLAQALEIDGQHAEAARIRGPFRTPESAAAATQVVMAQVEADSLAYDIAAARARRDPNARYVTGPGQLSRNPGRQHRAAGDATKENTK